MSLFPRGYGNYSPFQEVAPLFRILDDYANTVTRSMPQQMRTFNPSFDVREIKDAYELHGELPGIESENLSIEWTDDNTLTVSGRTEHRSERGRRPEAQASANASGANGEAPSAHEYHRPSVSEEAEDGSEKPAADASTENTEGEQHQQEEEDEDRYWVSERAIGSFSRSFSFPARVNHDAVKASLKNGILSIVVPKAENFTPRKIQVE
ncbi:small heat shock protein [Patellaria atrata CBS 101060]|uniref:Small heat shock protein n=1 Tax=Patellaria atrata CBS 101060 TaxID=1346257 RepID=A0A9P4SHW9_9PEZI|nr:small heat shock protein [Patellaria atrata CBS 101060]